MSHRGGHPFGHGRGPQTVTTILPWACPCPRYWRASGLRQGVRPVDGRLDLPGFQHLFQNGKILLCLVGRQQNDLPAPGRMSEATATLSTQPSRPTDDTYTQVGTNNLRRSDKGRLRRGPESRRTASRIASEVLLGVVDDMVCTEGTSNVHIARAAYRSDVCSSALAICTANVPTPPEAPLMRTLCPGWILCLVA